MLLLFEEGEKLFDGRGHRLVGDHLEEICEQAGYPGLLDMIADETVATTVEDLLPFLEEKAHPALTLDSLF